MKALLICNLIFLFLLFNEKSINAQLYPCNIDGSASFCGEQDISIRFNCGGANILELPTGFTKTTTGTETTVTGHISNSNSNLVIILFGGYNFSINTYYKPHPSITASINPICENSSFIISSGEAAETYLDFTWDSPSSVITTENAKTITSASTIHSGYYALTVNNNLTTGCSASTAKNITIVPKPLVNSTTPASRCGTGSVTLGASISAGTISWYNSDGSSAGTGASLTIPSLSSTTTFYVDATNNGCTSSPRIPVIATINNIPVINSTTPASRCDIGNVYLGASASEGIINWYSTLSGGMPIGTGVTFVTPAISTTTTYYAEATNNGCPSTRTPVIATINHTPTISCPNSANCGPGTVNLTATISGGTVNWYNTPVGGIPLSSSGTYSPTLPVTTTFYADVTQNGCTSSPRIPVTATINQLPGISHEFVQSSGCSPAANITGINLTPDDPAYTYLWAPGGASTQNISCLADGIDYTVTVTNNSTSCVTAKPISIRPKFTTILALDRTGSMSGKPSGYTFSKWELLKSDIDILTALINLNDITAMPADMLASMGYNSTQTVYAEAGNSYFPIFESVSTLTKVDAFMGSLNPSGVTSIGGALVKAIDLAGTESKPVYILLITDGLQNMWPKIDETTNEIKDNAGTKIIDLDDLPDNIHIYCIGIGSDCNHALLKQIALIGHGDYYSAFDPAELTTSVVQFYTDMYSGSSPKLIKTYNGTIESGNPISKEFLVNNATKINFLISFLEGEEKDFSLRKDNVEIPIKTTSGKNYKMVTLSFPLQVNGKTIKSSGTWRMNITSKKQNTTYSAFAIADVHNQECSFNAIQKGNVIGLKVKVPDADKYFKDLKVTAQVYKPLADAGNVFSNYSLNNFKSNKKNILFKDQLIIEKYKAANPDYSDLSNAQVKWTLLTSNHKITDLIRPKADSVKILTKGENNIFYAYTNSFFSGIYKINFTVEGTTIDNEPFYRSFQRELSISNTCISPDKTDIATIDSDPLHDIIVISPKTDIGNPVFKLSEGLMNIKLGGLDPIKVNDNLDGTITYYFKKGSINLQDKTLQIEQGKTSILNKKIKEIRKTNLSGTQKKILDKEIKSKNKAITK